MRIFKFHFSLILLFAYILTFSSCASDDNLEKSTVQPETPSPQIPHKLEFSYQTIFNDKQIQKLVKTNDNGYIGIFTDTDYINPDYIVIKFDINFNIIWEKRYGGSKKDYPNSIIQDKNGDYIIIGRSESNDGDLSENYGNFDLWLCKIDKNGDLLWQKSYGGSKDDLFQDIQPDGNGFVLIGMSNSNDHDFPANRGSFDSWLIKINKDGIIENKVNLGTNLDDYGSQLIPFNDNFIALISSVGNSGFQSIIQLSSNGQIIWKTQLNDLNSGAMALTQTGDILVVNNSAKDYILYRLSSNGAIKLRQNITFYDKYKKQPFTKSIIESKDGGVIIAGELGGGNYSDAIFFRTNSDFSSLISKHIIGNDMDLVANIIPLQNYNYIIPIMTSSTDLPMERDKNVFISTMFLSIIED